MIYQSLEIHESDVANATTHHGNDMQIEIDNLNIMLVGNAAWALADLIIEAQPKHGGTPDWAVTIDAGGGIDHIQIGAIDPEANDRWSSCWIKTWHHDDHEPRNVIELDASTALALATELTKAAAAMMQNIASAEVARAVSHDVTYSGAAS